MKIIAAFMVMAMFQLPSFSQKIESDPIALKRNKLNKQNMVVLGTWAAGNIVYGSIAAPNNTGNEKYFHRMNAYWNVANLGIAGIGYLVASKKHFDHTTLEQNIKEQKFLERILLINTGLDAGYILTGFYLQNRSKQQNLIENKYQMKGYGQSLVLQGGFLLAFDVFQYLQHLSNGKGLKELSSKAAINVSGQSIAFTYHF